MYILHSFLFNALLSVSDFHGDFFAQGMFLLRPHRLDEAKTTQRTRECIHTFAAMAGSVGSTSTSMPQSQKVQNYEGLIFQTFPNVR
jgi:hypothetical protein